MFMPKEEKGLSFVFFLTPSVPLSLALSAETLTKATLALWISAQQEGNQGEVGC